MQPDRRFDQIEAVLMDLMQQQDRANTLFSKLFDGDTPIVYGITRAESNDLLREMRTFMSEVREYTAIVNKRLGEIEQGLLDIQAGQYQALTMLREMREEIRANANGQ